MESIERIVTSFAALSTRVLQMLQCDDGHWAGDYGGPMFLMPGMIIAFHVTGTPLGEARRAGMEAYLRNHQQVNVTLRVYPSCNRRRDKAGTCTSVLAVRTRGKTASVSWRSTPYCTYHKEREVRMTELETHGRL